MEEGDGDRCYTVGLLKVINVALFAFVCCVSVELYGRDEARLSTEESAEVCGP